MATLRGRGFRRQMLGKLREYEGYLRRLEGEILIMRGKADRAVGEAQVKLGAVVADFEHGAEQVREAGRLALEGLTKATDVGSNLLEQLKQQITEAQAAAPSMLAKGRSLVRRASIEAQAIGFGLRMGVHVARRTSRRVKTAKA